MGKSSMMGGCSVQLAVDRPCPGDGTGRFWSAPGERPFYRVKVPTTKNCEFAFFILTICRICVTLANNRRVQVLPVKKKKVRFSFMCHKTTRRILSLLAGTCHDPDRTIFGHCSGKSHIRSGGSDLSRSRRRLCFHATGFHCRPGGGIAADWSDPL